MCFHYEVALITPIGRRKGQLDLSFHGTDIEGWLSLFGHRSAVSGTVCGEGRCQLAGHFTTLQNTFSYEAAGSITGESVELLLQCRRPAALSRVGSGRPVFFRLETEQEVSP